MTLRQLLQKSSYKSIFNCLHKEYYYKDPEDEIVKMAVAYREVISQLLSFPILPNEDYQIFIRSTEEDVRDEELSPKTHELASFIDVSLYASDDEQVYAIDLTPWEEIIDASIRKEIKMDHPCLAAHILWEITFYGFTTEEVVSERERLVKLQQRIDNGEEKLIPWEEIEKEIDEGLNRPS